MISDFKGRRFKSLRVSLTSACNLACTYCVPEKGMLRIHKNELSADKMYKAIELLTQDLGLEKIRLTGGEPLISKKLYELLPKLNRLPLKELCITTNGQILAENIDFLKENGISRINVSLDTLKADRYEAITRGGTLQKTLNGIEAALDRGFQVKINMIPINGCNEDEVVTLLDYCLERGIELRYIELMRMGHLADPKIFDKKLFAMPDILKMIGNKYQFQAHEAAQNSTALRFKVEDKGFFGVIANDSCPFCSNCDRLRLSSEGDIYGCLGSTEKYSIVPFLELSENECRADLHKILRAALATKRKTSFSGAVTNMKSVGG